MLLDGPREKGLAAIENGVIQGDKARLSRVHLFRVK